MFWRRRERDELGCAGQGVHPQVQSPVLCEWGSAVGGWLMVFVEGGDVGLGTSSPNIVICREGNLRSL